jgi:hypothetical protein
MQAFTEELIFLFEHDLFANRFPLYANAAPRVRIVLYSDAFIVGKVQREARNT